MWEIFLMLFGFFKEYIVSLIFLGIILLSISTTIVTCSNNVSRNSNFPLLSSYMTNLIVVVGEANYSIYGLVYTKYIDSIATGQIWYKKLNFWFLLKLGT